MSARPAWASLTLSKFKYIKYFKIAGRDVLCSQYKETSNTAGGGRVDHCHLIDPQCTHILNYLCGAGEVALFAVQSLSSSWQSPTSPLIAMLSFILQGAAMYKFLPPSPHQAIQLAYLNPNLSWMVLLLVNLLTSRFPLRAVVHKKVLFSQRRISNNTI